jgi:ribosomal protein S3
MIKHNIILGFYISISGKIGAAGSTKKKKWSYMNGKLNMSVKSCKLKYEISSLWTRSGCLGLKLYLAY